MKAPRQKIITEMLLKDGIVKTADLKASLGVSIETIRRDFSQLEENGILIKTYGGAVLAGQPSSIQVEPDSWQKRSGSFVKEKESIARQASKYIKDGILLAMDSGTTTLELARQLEKYDNLTVITNDLHIASTLMSNRLNQIYLIGGMLNENRSTSGYLAKEFLGSFSSIDMYIFGCDGVTLEDGFTTSSMESNELKQLLAERAKKKIAVVDHSKFERKALFKICGFEDVDIVITDSQTQEEVVQKIRKQGPQVDIV